MGRISDLEEISKARLKFNGVVTVKSAPESELMVQGIGANTAVTLSTSDLSKHLIKYAANLRLEDSVFFHEFCHVKLNEIGFKKAEALIEDAVAKCCSSESEIIQMQIARVLVAETLADSILYRFFRKESEDLRGQLDYSFCMTHSLRTIERKYGLQGITQAAAYRVAKEHSGFGDQVSLGGAIREAFGRGEVAKSYDAIFAALSELPSIGSGDSDDTVRDLNDGEVRAIVDCALRLFEIKTGKKCE
jgi:hypothetical protein